MSRYLMACTAAILSLSLLLSLTSCTGNSGGDDTANPDSTVLSSDDTGNSSANMTDDSSLDPPSAEDETSYTVPQKWEKDGKIQWEYTYSPDGRSLSKTDYTEESPITYTVTFNENGDPVSMEWTVAVNDTRTEVWRDDYYLDDAGRIIEEKRYCEGQIQNAYGYTYDSKGRMETQTSRNVKQENTIYRFLYDEMGTHIGTRYKKYNGEHGYHMEEKTCTYDSSGRITKEESPSLTVTHEYTLSDELVTREKITSTVGDYSWSYYYGYTYENGKLIKKDCSYDGAVTDHEYFTQTSYEHYFDAINWIFRERLP